MRISSWCVCFRIGSRVCRWCVCIFGRRECLSAVGNVRMIDLLLCEGNDGYPGVLYGDDGGCDADVGPGSGTGYFALLVPYILGCWSFPVNPWHLSGYCLPVNLVQLPHHSTSIWSYGTTHRQIDLPLRKEETVTIQLRGHKIAHSVRSSHERRLLPFASPALLRTP